MRVLYMTGAALLMAVAFFGLGDSVLSAAPLADQYGTLEAHEMKAEAASAYEKAAPRRYGKGAGQGGGRGGRGCGCG